MSLHHHEDLKRVAERASEWLDVLAEEHGPQERAAFAAWIAESPLHVREFLNIAAIDRQLESVDPARRMQHDARRDMAPANVLSLQDSLALSQPGKQPSEAVGNRAHRWRWAAGVATLALGLTVTWWWQERGAWHEYATAVGEQNTIKLADGTAVSLNTNSSMRVRFTGQGRDIRLLSGEALFNVRHDPQRPFRVHSGTSVIQAIGTEFNVYRRSADDITVAVIEGKVQISPVENFANAKMSRTENKLLSLAARESAHIAGDGRIKEKRNNIDPTTVTAWREHRLVFYRVTLQEIAGEFNRYNANPQIRVQDEALSARRYTVVLPANDPQSLVDYLREDPALAVENRGDEIVIRKRI